MKQLSKTSNSFIIVILSLLSSVSPAEEKLLNWPISLDKDHHKLGPNLSQYQEYRTRYFHGGQDLVGDFGQEVRTPVSGKIEGGYYSYEDFATGHSKKNYIALKDSIALLQAPLWGRRYFEIAVTDEQGRRFEFHHIDPDTLHFETVKLILSGGEVNAGDIIGTIVDMERINYGTVYNHIHYNIIDSSGAYLNPLFFSKPLSDTQEPKIEKVYFKKNGEELACKSDLGDLVTEVAESDLKSLDKAPLKNVEYLIIKASDYMTGNLIVHSITKLEVSYFNYETKELINETRHDFRYRLDPLSDIRAIYQNDFCLNFNGYIVDIKGSKNDEFYYKIPIPQGFVGEVSIKAYDFAGNKAEQSLLLSP